MSASPAPRRRLRAAALAAVAGSMLALPLAVERHAPSAAYGLALEPHAAPAEVTLPARAAAPSDQVNVSRASSAQAEVAVAVDPSRPNVLVAGSNSYAPAVRVYSSIDGGATWTSEPLPVPHGVCSFGDPAVAVDADGRQFYAFLTGPCDGRSRPEVTLALATRAGPDTPWTAAQLDIPGAATINDKEALAVDVTPTSPYFGRLYLAWSRFDRPSSAFEIVVSHSDDDGATWSEASRVSVRGSSPQTYSSLGIGSDGTLYVGWLTLDQHIRVDRSTDGGDQFGRDVTVDSAPFAAGFCSFGGAAIPAQSRRCVTPTPLVTVDNVHGRVHVTYSGSGTTGREKNVYVASFDTALSPLVTRRRVHPADVKYPSDQFLPASAVDASTGRLWACWYDTSGDRTRKRARYSCAASDDGGATWSKPRPAASVYSNETTPRAMSFQYGDYAGLAAAGGVAHPIWTDSRHLATLGEEIYTTALTLP